MNDRTTHFRPPIDAVWLWLAHEPFEVICHNGFAPYNIIFSHERPTGVIDFDTASPGPRVWDLAYTAYCFVPLTAPGNPDTPVSSAAEQLRRLSLFCTAYGVVDPASLLQTAVQRLSELIDFIVTSAASGNAAQQHVLARGDVDIYTADRSYIREQLI